MSYLFTSISYSEKTYTITAQEPSIYSLIWKECFVFVNWRQNKSSNLKLESSFSTKKRGLDRFKLSITSIIIFHRKRKSLKTKRTLEVYSSSGFFCFTPINKKIPLCKICFFLLKMLKGWWCRLSSYSRNKLSRVTLLRWYVHI